MKRLFLQELTGVLGLAVLPTCAHAQNSTLKYPNRTITAVLPASAGGGADGTARLLAELMSKELGQPIVIDNKPGGGGNIGVQAVTRAPADGYTLLLTHVSPIYYSPFLYPKLPYDPLRDLAFISHICDGGWLMAVHRDVPVGNLPEFVAWVRRQGQGKVTYGSYGVGSGSHLILSYLSDSRGLGMVHVPYKGDAPMVQDLAGGQIQVAMGGVSTIQPHITSGRLRPLALIGKERSMQLPDVATAQEQGFKDPEFKLVGGMLLMAPAATPLSVIARLEAAARTATQTPRMRAWLAANSLPVLGTTGAQARKMFEDSIPAVKRLVKISGATLY
jgi:tripartite-type tricarboxylate transporter receptor subunit TctC